MITVSIVSHGHGKMVSDLALQLLHCPEVDCIIITLNIPEDLKLNFSHKIKILKNETPKGFGSNHNFAFLQCSSTWFLVINPDVTIIGNPFQTLFTLNKLFKASILAPVVFSPDGKLEDSWRHFPNLGALIKKLLKMGDGTYNLSALEGVISPIDWASGLFLLCNSAAYKQLVGFNEKYYMYYEDVDLCFRAKKIGFYVGGCRSVSIIHNARRQSRKNFKFMYWHLISLLRYLFTISPNIRSVK